MPYHNFLVDSILPYYQYYIVSVLGKDKGFTVKYTPLRPKGTPEGKGLYFTVYPESVCSKYSDI